MSNQPVTRMTITNNGKEFLDDLIATKTNEQYNKFFNTNQFENHKGHNSQGENEIQGFLKTITNNSWNNTRKDKNSHTKLPRAEMIDNKCFLPK